MKHLLYIFTILFFISDVSSNEIESLVETQSVAYCGPAKQIENLTVEAGQVPIWVGMRIIGSPASIYILTSDQDGEWTMIQVVGNVACIIALGDKNMKAPRGLGV